LILTVANYYKPDGKSILEEGVAPTEVVRAASLAADDGEDGEDVASPGASPQKEPPAGPRPLSSDDPVLRRALELLKAPASAKKAA
jgi:C-terminal processing protease CtpA/Prc